MPVVDVVNLDGKKVGQLELADAIFGAKVNQHLLHEASRWYLRGLRSGTHKSKDKSEVSGAGRKLWKQKGTGRAADFALVFGLVRARAQSAQIPARSFVQQMRIHLRAKYRVGKLHLTDLLAIQIDYIHDRHNLDSFFSQLPLLRKIPLKNCYEHVATSRVLAPEPERLPSWRSSRDE